MALGPSAPRRQQSFSLSPIDTLLKASPKGSVKTVSIFESDRFTWTYKSEFLPSLA
jgi:hypothetical protein